MKSFFYSAFALLLLLSCNNQSNTSSNETVSTDSTAASAADNDPKAEVKFDSPRIISVVRKENFVPFEDASEESQEMLPHTWKYSYDEQGRLTEIIEKSTGGNVNTYTFDYSQSGKIIESAVYNGEGDPQQTTYFIDTDGYVTKVKTDFTVYSYKYKDGNVVSMTESEGGQPVTFKWKDGNIVSSTRTYSDGVDEVTTYTYTDIPLEANFDYGYSFTWFGAERVHLLSKGFNCKNYVATMTNDHPIEDEYTHDKDKDGKVKMIHYHRCGDTYNSEAEITAVIK